MRTTVRIDEGTGSRSDGRHLGDQRPYGLHDFLSGWHNAERHECAAVDHHLVVDEDLELAVPAFDEIDFGLQLTAKARRHTDGVDAGDSIRAVADGDASHAFLLVRLKADATGIHQRILGSQRPTCFVYSAYDAPNRDRRYGSSYPMTNRFVAAKKHAQ
jgi:hypothetical protein